VWVGRVELWLRRRALWGGLLIRERSLFDVLQPAPPALADVIARLEAHLVEAGFLRLPAAPTTALYSLECLRGDEPSQGSLLVLCVAYAERQKPPAKREARK
jgi:hypothetical protein